jgi:hypothetical protein
MALEDAAAIDWQKPAKDGSLTGEPKMDTAWYLDTWRRLVEADQDRWFLLHARPWNERDIPRVQEELYLHATQIRRWHDQLEVYVDNINRGEMTLQEVLDIAQPEYPRSPGMCQQYGRLCPYYDTCSTGQLQSDLHRVPVRHMELTDTQDDQGELA